MQFQTPNIEQGFGTQYHGTTDIQAFYYDLSQSTLYTIYPAQNYDVFLNVPQNIAQQLAVAQKQLFSTYLNPVIPDPDLIYEQSIAGQFPQCRLLENGAPRLCENGNYRVLE